MRDYKQRETRGKKEQLSDIKIHKNALEVMILASFLPPKNLWTEK